MAASARSGALPADLDLALGAERLAVVFYGAVRTQLAVDRPFSNIVLAEGNHVASLEKLYAKRELELPPPPDDVEIMERVAGYSDISQACAGAVEHERLIDGYYEVLLGTELPMDVAKVLQRLKAATLERHLDAFMKCAES